MYDTAKRSLAFTVATGGLLLAGTGFTPVQAATGQGQAPEPASAQAGQGAAALLSPHAASTPINVRIAPPQAAPVQPMAAPQAGSAAQSTVKSSGGLLSGNSIQAPLNLGLNLCGNQAVAAAVNDRVGGVGCADAGSGASAVSGTSHSGGVGSGNTVQVPVNVPINACGNQAVVAGLLNTVEGVKCSSGGAGAPGSTGASATSVTDRSGGAVSGNTVQVPVNVPINACGNQAVVGGLHNLVWGTECSNGSAEGSGSNGASATSVTVHSGGAVSGNSVQAPVNVPVNLCGNQVVVGGLRNTVAGELCRTTTGTGTSSTSATIDSGGVGAGNSVHTPISVPVNACGNQVEAAAVGNRDLGVLCEETGPATDTVTSVTVNSGGAGSGNTVNTPIHVPANVCGNQVGAAALKLDDGDAACGNGSMMSPPPPPPSMPCPPPPTTPCPPSSPPPSGPTSPPPSGPTSPPPTSPTSPPPTGPTSPPPSGPTSPPPSGPTSPPPVGPTSMPPTSPSSPGTPPGHGAPPSGSLARTGTDGAIALVGAGGAVLAGVGLRRVSRRKSRA
jgi:hypothetical protein